MLSTEGRDTAPGCVEHAPNGTCIRTAIVSTDGDDALFGDDGNDTVRGGEGNDTIEGGNGNDFLFGDNGNDIFNVLGVAATVSGGAGIDTVNSLNTFVLSADTENDSDVLAITGASAHRRSSR